MKDTIRFVLFKLIHRHGIVALRRRGVIACNYCGAVFTK